MSSLPIGSWISAGLSLCGLTEERVRRWFGCNCPARKETLDQAGDWVSCLARKQVRLWRLYCQPGVWRKMRFPDNAAWLTWGWLFRAIFWITGS